MKAFDFFDQSRETPEPPGGCGDCTACCTSVGVEEINKPPAVACPHLCGSGCGIYADRPHSCRAWSCLWRRGVLTGGLDYRPDRLGLILDVTECSIDYKEGQCLSGWETRPGALDEPRTAYFLRKLGRDIPLVIRLHGGGFRVSGPRPFVAAAREIARVWLENEQTMLARRRATVEIDS